MEQTCKEVDMIKTHVECSSLTGENLELVFREACRVALESSVPVKKKKSPCSIL